MERINWIEFREWVPAKIRTVLLPLGTLEPHGVAPNGTDILAPGPWRERSPRASTRRQDRGSDSRNDQEMGHGGSVMAGL